MSGTASSKRSKGLSGVRLNPSHADRVREKIRTSQLINRLELFSLGEKDAQSGKPVEMTSTQVTAALGVLKKTLPDLSSVEGNLKVSLLQHEDALSELE